MVKRVGTFGAASLMVALALGAGAVPASAARSFPNCKAMNKVYEHGVGLPNAKDKIGGKYIPGRSVTDFRRSAPLYNANTGRDRDKDGVACEK